MEVNFMEMLNYFKDDATSFGTNKNYELHAKAAVYFQILGKCLNDGSFQNDNKDLFSCTMYEIVLLYEELKKSNEKFTHDLYQLSKNNF